jgi:hypothetical protein
MVPGLRTRRAPCAAVVAGDDAKRATKTKHPNAGKRASEPAKARRRLIGHHADRVTFFVHEREGEKLRGRRQHDAERDAPHGRSAGDREPSVPASDAHAGRSGRSRPGRSNAGFHCAGAVKDRGFIQTTTRRSGLPSGTCATTLPMRSMHTLMNSSRMNALCEARGARGRLIRSSGRKRSQSSGLTAGRKRARHDGAKGGVSRGPIH